MTRALAVADLAPDRVYKILCGLIVPRPIALVTSLSEAGVVNAAPFSFFNVFSEAPPLVVLGLQHKPGRVLKDTTLNIRESGEFVVNMVDAALAEAMNITAINFPPDMSEVEAAGLATAPSLKVRPPRLAQSPAAMECRKTVSLSFGPHRELLVGEVVQFHIADGVMDDAFNVDVAAYQPIARLFGNLYAHQGEVFELTRPTFAEWQAQKG
jgi:flavin reductase (DIM6/NTAB) family NADH-FMN oxidoreductase RutF